MQNVFWTQRYNKYLTNLVFSVCTISYAWARHKPERKISVRTSNSISTEEVFIVFTPADTDHHYILPTWAPSWLFLVLCEILCSFASLWAFLILRFPRHKKTAREIARNKLIAKDKMMAQYSSGFNIPSRAGSSEKKPTEMVAERKVFRVWQRSFKSPGKRTGVSAIPLWGYESIFNTSYCVQAEGIKPKKRHC